jgi:plastocyanin
MGPMLVCNKAYLVALLAALSLSNVAIAGELNASVTQSDGTPVQDAVISVRAKGQDSLVAAANTRATMLQEGQRFRPFILPIQVGTTVEFPNRDPFRHHVYSFAKAKTFELKLYDSSEAETMTFDREGVIPLGCNIHDNMLAYVYVVGTPNFVLTNKEGRSVVETLPAGEYTVEAWHPHQRLDSSTKNITIAAEGSSQVQFELDLKRSFQQRDPGEFDETEY